MIPFGQLRTWIERARSHRGLRWTALLSGAVVMSWLSAPEAPSAPTPARRAAEDGSAIDTLIPSGMVLVPIQIANSESLDSIIGKYAVVDLYRKSESMRFRRPLLKGVKLLRAPKNPQEFGVLVPEDLAPTLAGLSDPVFVTVQNPTRPGPLLEREGVRRVARRQISYEE